MNKHFSMEKFPSEKFPSEDFWSALVTSPCKALQSLGSDQGRSLPRIFFAQGWGLKQKWLSEGGNYKIEVAARQLQNLFTCNCSLHFASASEECSCVSLPHRIVWSVQRSSVAGTVTLLEKSCFLPFNSFPAHTFAHKVSSIWILFLYSSTFYHIVAHSNQKEKKIFGTNLILWLLQTPLQFHMVLRFFISLKTTSL